MATLAAGIDATQTVIPVSGAAPETGSYLTVGTEAVRFLGTSRGPQGRSFLRSYWSVDRGIAGSTAASHLSGAPFTQYYPDADGDGNGGAGLPSQWTDGGDGDVTATSADPAKIPFSIQQPTGAAFEGADAFVIVGEDLDPDDNAPLLEVGYDGGITIFGRAGNNPQVYVQEGDLGEFVSFGGQGIGLSTRAATAEKEAIWASSLDTGLRTVALWKTGAVMFSGVVPADGDIPPGGVCFMYFDSTDGAAKIRFKGKSANGTVVTGSLNLT
jgi:hypothetical protein